MRSAMLVMYWTSQTPFSPGTRPRFGVPSASRGVGSDGASLPRRPCAPNATCSATAMNTAMVRADETRRPRRAPGTTDLLAKLGPLRRLPLTRCRKQPLSGALQLHRPGVAAMAAVLGKTAFDRHDVAWLHGRPGPAVSHQAIRAAHLHAPVGNLVVVLDVDVEPHVGVHPFSLGDRSRQTEWFVGVEFGAEGVVRHEAD